MKIQDIRCMPIRRKLGYLDKTLVFRLPDICTCPEKMFLYENTNLYTKNIYLINPRGDNGKFVVKKNSGAAQGLTVITGNHQRIVGKWFKNLSINHTLDEDKDIILEEDVWIGANVTLLSGVTIGRGSTKSLGYGAA